MSYNIDHSRYLSGSLSVPDDTVDSVWPPSLGIRATR
jgi:hypothetical protein